MSAPLLKAVLKICRNARHAHTEHARELRAIEIDTLRRLKALRRAR